MWLLDVWVRIMEVFLLDLWVSKDDYYMRPKEVQHAPGDGFYRHWSPVVTRLYQRSYSPVTWRCSQVEGKPVPACEGIYGERVFEHQLLRFPDLTLFEAYRISVNAAATIRIDGRWLQHYPWGEMSPDDWRRLDDELRLTEAGIF